MIGVLVDTAGGDTTTLLAALFGALAVGVPGTIAAVANLRNTKAGRAAAEEARDEAAAANKAVNHKPADEPTLYERLQRMEGDVGAALVQVDSRLVDVERHQAQTFDRLVSIDSRLDGHAVAVAGIGARLATLADSIATLADHSQEKP